MIVVGLVLLTTALPAATVCCAGKPDSTMAAMYASMPCCATNCTMSGPNASRDHDVALTASSPQPAAPAVGTLTVLASSAAEAIATVAKDGAAIERTAPPPFLLHRQFRI